MSDTPTRIEVDCTTGEVKEIPLTEAEIQQQQLDSIAAATAAQERAAAEAAVAAAKESATAKLATLGLTADEIAALTK
jgi:hypothetical protein